MSNGLVMGGGTGDIITNNRIKTRDNGRNKQAGGLVWGVRDGNNTSQGGSEAGSKSEGSLRAFWVGVMIRENKKATVDLSHTHIHGGFQSGHQAVVKWSHGHDVRWPMASRLINKQSGMEGQIRDRCGVGAGRGARGWELDWSLASDDSKVSMRNMAYD